jgi:sarcosine oxidase subunit beta
MAETADVIVVGAGIMGASTAYHLARRRFGKVPVLERDTVCSGSSALASGGIRHQYANQVGVELTKQSILTFENFEDEFGVDPQFRQHGYLILVGSEEHLTTARERRAPAPTRRRRPAAHARGDAPALPVPHHGRSARRDLHAPRRLCRSLPLHDGHRRARDLGVSIKQHHEIAGFVRQDACVSGVITRHGVFEAPVVVIAAGAWSGGVGNGLIKELSNMKRTVA